MTVDPPPNSLFDFLDLVLYFMTPVTPDHPCGGGCFIAHL